MESRMKHPAALSPGVILVVETLTATIPTAPAAPRRSTSAINDKLRTLANGIGRAFEWYVEHVLDFAPLLDVLGHGSAGALARMTMRPEPTDRSTDTSEQGETHD